MAILTHPYSAAHYCSATRADLQGGELPPRLARLELSEFYDDRLALCAHRRHTLTRADAKEKLTHIQPVHCLAYRHLELEAQLRERAHEGAFLRQRRAFARHTCA